MPRVRRDRAVLIAALLSIVAAAPAARQAASPCAGAQSNPPDASLQLSLKHGQATFQEGELIGLVLAFTSTVPQKYFLSRGGSMNIDVFCLEPAAGRDPLADSFGSGIFGGFMGGGIGGTAPLGATPSIAEIDLNVWRVLPPGRYRLRLRSGQVDRGATKDEPGSGSIHVPLWSNVVEFQVIAATVEWQDAQLRAAIVALDSGPEEGARRGARVLRFLGSESATRELVRRFELRSEQANWEFRFGLIGSVHRQLAIDSMKAALVDPARPITAEFLKMLALLEIEIRPEYKVPPFTEANRDAWGRLSERRREAYQGLITQHLKEVMAALGKKTDAARAVTVNTLFAAPASAAIDRASLRNMLVASWDSLPVRTRDDLLQSRWDDIGGPDLLPILRQIASAPPPVGREVTQQVDRELALARLYELAPAEGREWILREMVASRRSVGMAVLGLLPDKELPGIEEPIFARLRGDAFNEVDYQLLERYGTARALPEVQRAYARARGRWACTLQSSALRLFLTRDPAFGAAEVAYALAQRTETGCYQFLLSNLKEKLAVPEVERIAVAALDDPSPEVVRDAAQALGANGSPAAESALWRRLEQFHAEWKDRAHELRVGPALDDPRAANATIEYALMNAISKAQAWICNVEKLQRLQGLIVSPLLQTEIAERSVAWQRGEFNLQVRWSQAMRAMFYDVAGYSGDSLDRLVHKLRQFPPGTRIVWSLMPAMADRHSTEVEAVREAARAAGVVLQTKYP